MTEHADVVLPVAPAAEKAGRFVNWEGRRRPFDLTLTSTGAVSDARVLDALADELDVYLGAGDDRRGARRTGAGSARARPPGRVGRAAPPPALPCPRRRPGRPCWPPGPSCSTPAACPTATRTWPARPSRPRGAVGRRPRPARRRRRRAGHASTAGRAVDRGAGRGQSMMRRRRGLAADQRPRLLGALALGADRRGSSGHRDVPRERRCRMSSSGCCSPQRDRRDPGLRPATRLDDPDQGPRRLRLPGRHDAVLDRVRAQGRRPHAEPHRPEPHRAVGHAAVAGRRREAGLQGRDHPAARRQAGLLHRADPLGRAGLPRVRGHPVRPGRCPCSATTRRCS